MISRERILVVAHEFTLGDAAYLALRHIRRLTPRYKIDFLVTGPCEEKMLCQLPKQVSVFRLKTDYLESNADGLRCLELVLEQRQTPPFQRSYRAALATSVFPDWRACIATSLVQAPRKLVFLVDEGLARYPRLRPPERNAIECCLMAADLVIPVSKRLWQRMAESCPLLTQRPWQVLRPPVDTDKILSLSRKSEPGWEPRDRPVVLTVARLSADKQISQNLLVHHRLRQTGVEFRWYVVGSGTEEATLRAEVNRLGMAGSFFLLGDRENEDVISLMKQCDVFALFSSSEGCPVVVIEALLAGCAVIMTDVNGADELIDNGRTGLIVPNNADDIAEGLSRLVLDSGLRDRFRRNLAKNPLISDAAQETTWLVERIEEPVFAPAAPKVSILIPTYNHQQFIDRAIASALMQDFPSLEVVVADDASTDRTETLARTWTSDPRFRYTRNERNLGRVANYRKALTEHARGEWVLMLDGDDHLSDPGFIRHAWEALQRHANQSLVFAQAGHRVHYTRGDRQDVDILPFINGPERLMTGNEYLRFVYETGFFTHLGTLYHRRTAIKNGCYTAQISSSDMDSLLRLALEGKVLILNTIAGCWVQYGGNASSNLPLNEIAANVRIFRQITRMAVQRGLTSMSQIDGALTRYEARTLAYLFGQTLGKTARGPLAVLKMLAIITFLNPRLLLNRRLISSCNRYLRKLTRLALKRRV